MLTYSDAGALPANCGLVFIDGTVVKNNAYCIACKAGYYIKTYNAVTTWKIDACEAVPACPNNTFEALNRCSGCVYEYDPVTDMVSTTASTNCIAPKQSNCFAGVMSSGALVCHVCDPGYELTNGKCLIIKVPNCKDKKSNIFDTFNQKHKVISARFFQYAWIWQQIDMKGCVECESPNDILYLNTAADDYLHPAVCS